MLGAISLVEELPTHVEPGHQGKPQELTEATQLIGQPMLVHKMFLGAEDGIVVEETVQHIDGLTDRPGNHLGVQDAVLVRNMGLHRQGLIVIPKVARRERAQQRAGLQPEALAIRGGDRAIPPDRTER